MTETPVPPDEPTDLDPEPPSDLDPAAAGAPGPDPDPIDLSHEDRDRDGVDALRDVEAEQGSEQGVADALELDERAAEEVGTRLDRTQPDEPPLP